MVKAFDEYPPGDPGSVGFRFTLSRSVYEITYDGTGKRTDANGDTLPSRLDLDGDDPGSLVGVQYVEFSGDIILTGECSGSDAGWGFITRLDGKSLKPKWRDSISHFNIGTGLIEDRYAYLTGIGFVAKLDLYSGTYVWRHDDLYVGSESDPVGKRDRFIGFEIPRLEGDVVLFEESTDYPPAKTLKVDKQNGKILQMGE